MVLLFMEKGMHDDSYLIIGDKERINELVQKAWIFINDRYVQLVLDYLENDSSRNIGCSTCLVIPLTQKVCRNLRSSVSASC